MFIVFRIVLASLFLALAPSWKTLGAVRAKGRREVLAEVQKERGRGPRKPLACALTEATGAGMERPRPHAGAGCWTAHSRLELVLDLAL